MVTSASSQSQSHRTPSKPSALDIVQTKRRSDVFSSLGTSSSYPEHERHGSTSNLLLLQVGSPYEISDFTYSQAIIIPTSSRQDNWTPLVSLRCGIAHTSDLLTKRVSAVRHEVELGYTGTSTSINKTAHRHIWPCLFWIFVHCDHHHPGRIRQKGSK